MEIGPNSYYKKILNFCLKKKTYSFGEAAVEADAEAALLIVLSNKDEHLRANSKASIQHRPAALFGALKMQCEVGRG